MARVSCCAGERRIKVTVAKQRDKAKTSGISRRSISRSHTRSPVHGASRRDVWSSATRVRKFGVRGYTSAFDAATGNLAWRVFTVPGDPVKGFESKALEAAAKTWSGEFWKAGGGGTAWDAIVHDPELDLVYFGTGTGTAWATRIDTATGRPVESQSAYAGTKAVLVSPDPEGAPNWQPIAFDAARGVVYLSARHGSTRVHAPNAKWVNDITNRNMGDDPRYEGELNAQAAAEPAPRGELLAWSPVEGRAVWRVSLPVVQSGGSTRHCRQPCLPGSQRRHVHSLSCERWCAAMEFRCGHRRDRPRRRAQGARHAVVRRRSQRVASARDSSLRVVARRSRSLALLVETYDVPNVLR